LIIEDETPAADRLKKMILDFEPKAEVTSNLVSIASSVKWLLENPAPDLIFMDIHLSDGDSFEIFKEMEVKTPVVFVTAYDQYALEAFKVNSIDYLLKPVKKEDLSRALDKYRQRGGTNMQQMMELLKQMNITPSKRETQKRIVIRYGDTIKMVEIADVAYFYTEDKINFLCTKDNVRYPIDQNLDELESIIDDTVFFRINRQYIINISAIDKMLAWSKSRVKVILKPTCDQETIVSTERSPHFKEWLTGQKN
ncbi:MAG: LytR/AlgR family response regulator transcription factor, partial [Bacteroidota bacterium]